MEQFRRLAPCYSIAALWNPSNFYSTMLQCCNKAPNGETVPFLERTIISWIRIFHTIQLVTVRKSHLLFESPEMQITACIDKNHRNKQTYLTPSRKIESKQYLFHKAALQKQGHERRNCSIS